MAIQEVKGAVNGQVLVTVTLNRALKGPQAGKFYASVIERGGVKKVVDDETVYAMPCTFANRIGADGLPAPQVIPIIGDDGVAMVNMNDISPTLRPGTNARGTIEIKQEDLEHINGSGVQSYELSCVCLVSQTGAHQEAFAGQYWLEPVSYQMSIKRAAVVSSSGSVADIQANNDKAAIRAGEQMDKVNSDRAERRSQRNVPIRTQAERAAQNAAEGLGQPKPAAAATVPQD